MGGFEETIARDIRLAFFVPGVVYLADAVGTQTEALIIRGLAAKADVQRAFGLEVLTGLAMGLLLGGLAFPAVWLVFGTADLALAVALALMAACSLATVVAMLLPWAMAKAGRPCVRQRTAGHGHSGPAVATRVLPDCRADRRMMR